MHKSVGSINFFMQHYGKHTTYSYGKFLFLCPWFDRPPCIFLLLYKEESAILWILLIRYRYGFPAISLFLVWLISNTVVGTIDSLKIYLMPALHFSFKYENKVTEIEIWGNWLMLASPKEANSTNCMVNQTRQNQKRTTYLCCNYLVHLHKGRVQIRNQYA